MKSWACTQCGADVSKQDLIDGQGGVVEQQVFCADCLTDKTWPCAGCKCTVTKQDLIAGKGGVIDSSVFCAECLPAAQAGTLEPPAPGRGTEAVNPDDVREPAPEPEGAPEAPVQKAGPEAAEDKPRKGAPAPRKGKKAPSGAHKKPSERRAAVAKTESRSLKRVPSKKSNTPVFIIIGAVVLAVIVGVVLMAGGDKDAPKSSGQDSVPVSDGPTADDVSAPGAPPAGGGTGAAEAGQGETPVPDEPIDREAVFAKAMAEAEKAFDGSPEGFATGKALLEERIFGADAFKNSDFARKAEELIKEETEELGLIAIQEFGVVEKSVLTVMKNLKEKESLELVNAFEGKYADWPETKKVCNALREDIQRLIGERMDEWVSGALEMAEKGEKDEALSNLKEMQEALAPQMLAASLAPLKRAAERIRKGVKTSGEPDEVEIIINDAQTLFQRAESDFNCGSIMEAEVEFKRLQTEFKRDRVTLEEGNWIKKRLRQISDMKKRGANEDVRLLFFEDCERFVSYTRSRVGWRGGNLQSTRTFMKSKAAIKSRLSMAKTKGPALRAAVQGEAARNKALFYIEGDAVFTFWYFITSSRGKVKGDRLHINLRNRSQMDDFFTDVRNPVRGKWSFCAVPVKKFKGRALFGANFKEGDKISGFTIGYGSPGDEVTLYIDNICAVAGSTLYYIKDKVLERAKIIDDITVDFRKEHYSMDIYMLEKMIGRLASAKTLTNRGMILAVGDQHMNSTFVGLLKGASGKKVMTNKGAGTDRITTPDILSAVEDLLPKVKPGMTVICTGLNDVVSGMGDASIFETTLQMMIQVCYEHGSLPILITIPAVKDDDIGQGIYEFNKIVQAVAEEHDLPMVDAYKLFSFMEDNNRYYSNKILLSKAGYHAIAKKFGKIAKAINKWVFK